MPLQLIASDLDGTLLRSDATVSPRTARAIAAADEAGVPFVLVTGRRPRSMSVLAELTGHHGVAVCANGALVYSLRTESVLRMHPLPSTTALDLVHELRSALPDVELACDRLDHTGETRVGLPDAGVEELRTLLAPPIVRLIVRHPEAAPALLQATKELFDGFSQLATVTSASTTRSGGRLEITGPGVTKALSLAHLADDLDVGPEDVVAFGDMPNDLPMLAWAGTAVAVANADPLVAELADEVTASNDDDGVAIVVERELARRRG